MATQEQLAFSDSETRKHVRLLRRHMRKAVTELRHRADVHDASKFEEPERSIFAENVGVLAKTQYGTPEYYALLEATKPAIVHHHSKNRHHPEHWPNGIDDMTLIDLLEMICDWKAATERNKDGNIRKSVEHNAKRFNMSPQLTQIFENTVRELFPE